MKQLKRIFFIILSITSILFFCSDDEDSNNNSAISELSKQADFYIISDPHYYDPELGTSGTAFDNYLAKDRKMIAESEAIMEKTVEMIIAAKPEFVLIPGDLTKDGEKTSHEKFSLFLKELEDNGIDVFVVPGNHDVNNPESYSYSGETAVKVPNISSAEFQEIYYEFGYQEASSTDPYSLSYLVKYRDDLWILGTDPCLYEQNTEGEYSITKGEYKQGTLDWISARLEEAQNAGAVVLAMAHHGIIPHWTMQKQLFSDYVIENWESVSSQFAAAGLKIVFTGHFHAQDIVKKEFDNGNFLYDVETGSLVSYPCPLRKISIHTNLEMTVNSILIESINYDLKGKTFQAYSKDYLLEGLVITVTSILKNPLYNVSDEEIQTILPLLITAMTDHYQGDEVMNPEYNQLITDSLINTVSPSKQMLGLALQSIWNDPPPADNEVKISLKTGAVLQ